MFSTNRFCFVSQVQVGIGHPQDGIKRLSMPASPLIAAAVTCLCVAFSVHGRDATTTTTATWTMISQSCCPFGPSKTPTSSEQGPRCLRARILLYPGMNRTKQEKDMTAATGHVRSFDISQSGYLSRRSLIRVTRRKRSLARSLSQHRNSISASRSGPCNDKRSARLYPISIRVKPLQLRGAAHPITSRSAGESR